MALATTPPQLPANAATEYGFGWFVDTYRGEKRWSPYRRDERISQRDHAVPRPPP